MYRNEVAYNCSSYILDVCLYLGIHSNVIYMIILHVLDYQWRIDVKMGLMFMVIIYYCRILVAFLCLDDNIAK